MLTARAMGLSCGENVLEVEANVPGVGKCT